MKNTLTMFMRLGSRPLESWLARSVANLDPMVDRASTTPVMFCWRSAVSALP